jgi:uncharacterized membrane protein YtjA (UPF0391 family)
MSGIDPLRIVFLLAVLILVISLNRGMFERLGWPGTVRMALIWGSIFVGLALLASIIGVPERFRR